MGLSLSDLKVVSFVLLLGSILPAQAEVSTCKEITAVPAIVNTSGIWCLKKNLTLGGTTGQAIDVQIPAVTIDLNGFTITGSTAASTQAIGIHSLNRRNVTIRNGTLRGFLVGISLEGAASINDVIEDMHVDQAQHDGIRVKLAVGTIVRNNQITAIGGTTFDPNFGVEIDRAKNTTISNNNINGVSAILHADGVGITNADLTEVRDNSILNILRIDDGSGGGTGSFRFEGVASFTSTSTTIQNNRILNGVAAGTTGILGSGGSGVNCINNVIYRYGTPLSGCTFDSGNLTPP